MLLIHLLFWLVSLLFWVMFPPFGGFVATPNEALIGPGVVSAVLISWQIRYMKKQDKTNELLMELSSRVSAVLTISSPGGDLGLINVGQIDLFIESIDVGPNSSHFSPPLYSPPAGDQSFKIVATSSFTPHSDLEAGDYGVRIKFSDSLKRKWMLEGVVTKHVNSRGFNLASTSSVTLVD
jgi:hypothetical protein